MILPEKYWRHLENDIRTKLKIVDDKLIIKTCKYK